MDEHIMRQYLEALRGDVEFGVTTDWPEETELSHGAIMTNPTWRAPFGAWDIELAQILATHHIRLEHPGER